MTRRVSTRQVAQKVVPLKPRLNKLSLARMAERHRTNIQASIFRNRILLLLHFYLTHVINDLHKRDHLPHELIEVEKDLEAIDAALVHHWISPPYNEALLIPRRFPDEHKGRITNVLEETKKLKRQHLKLAYSRAA
ncbi:MAG: hypothetical protein Q7T11_04010 [Deltaproteobacteria bacterium]|nr:hypothetical protein [Deltaproteobacteria bacterium]